MNAATETIPAWASDIKLYDGQSLELVNGGALVRTTEFDVYEGFALTREGGVEYLGKFVTKREASREVLRIHEINIGLRTI